MSAPAIARPRVSAVPRFSRVLDAEARRTVDDRAGFWLLTVTLAVVVLGAVAVLTLGSPGHDGSTAFMLGVSFPLALALPLIAILLVTSDGGRSPAAGTARRGQVLGAKALVSAVIAIGVPLLVFMLGSLGVLASAATHGAAVVGDVSAGAHLRLAVFTLLAMTAGFVVAALARTRSRALISYAALLVAAPATSGLLAALPGSWRAAGVWIDLPAAMYQLQGATMPGTAWLHLATASVLWLVVPGVVGVRRLLRRDAG